MNIINLNGKLIAENCDLADNFLSRASGLIFSTNKKRSILFKFDKQGFHPIHSILVPYSFHAVYLDENMKVVDVLWVTPYKSLVRHKKPAKYLLESYNLKLVPKIGDVLQCLDGKF